MGIYMAAKTNIRFLKKSLLVPQPVSWFLHAQAFHYAGLKMVEKYGQISSPANKNPISVVEIFNRQNMYKVAVYLLSHSIELLLKGLVSSLDDDAESCGHDIPTMVGKLKSKFIVSIDEKDDELFELVDVYLNWFGRYYCPLPKHLDKVVKKAYTNPDEEDMVMFKFSPKYPDTHGRLDKLFNDLYPKNLSESALSLPSIIFCQ
jgi:HEPN domain-containing protein